MSLNPYSRADEGACIYPLPSPQTADNNNGIIINPQTFKNPMLPSDYQQQNLILSHKIYMFAIWSLCVQIPRLLIRYTKVTLHNYLNLHSISMTIFSLVTIYYIAVMLILSGVTAEELATNNILYGHYICALLMVAVLVVQMGTGVAVRAMVLAERYYRCLKVVKVVHGVSGYLVIALGRVAVSLGLIMNGVEELYKSWFFVLGAIYLVIIIIEAIYRMELSVFVRETTDTTKTNKDLPEQYTTIAKLLEQGVPTEKILSQFPSAKYVLVNNNIYCVQDLDHPGGEFIIQQILGREINYYLMGSHATLSCPVRHKHSKYLWNYFTKRFVANLKIERTIVCDDDEVKPEWIVNSVDQYSRALSVFKFSSKVAKFKNSFNTLKTLGKYMIIESYGEGIEPIKRPYSTVMCMTDDNIKFRKQVKDIYTNRQLQEYVERLQAPAYSETLPLAIKLSPPGEFTTYLNNFSHKGFKIHGPYGRGLNLSENSRGVYVVIAGGSGILPFLDLFDFMLRKIIFKVLQQRFGTVEAQNINPHRYNYELLDELKIKLYASFTSKEQFYGSSIITDLYFLNDIHGFDYFDLALRFSNGDQQEGIRSLRHSFDQVFIKEIIDTQPDRIFVCGTDTMNKIIRDHLINLDFNMNKVIIL